LARAILQMVAGETGSRLEFPRRSPMAKRHADEAFPRATRLRARARRDRVIDRCRSTKGNRRARGSRWRSMFGRPSSDSRSVLFTIPPVETPPPADDVERFDFATRGRDERVSFSQHELVRVASDAQSSARPGNRPLASAAGARVTAVAKRAAPSRRVGRFTGEPPTSHLSTSGHTRRRAGDKGGFQHLGVAHRVPATRAVRAVSRRGGG